jgi:hypothetical protein
MSNRIFFAPHGRECYLLKVSDQDGRDVLEPDLWHLLPLVEGVASDLLCRVFLAIRIAWQEGDASNLPQRDMDKKRASGGRIRLLPASQVRRRTKEKESVAQFCVDGHFREDPIIKSKISFG